MQHVFIDVEAYGPPGIGRPFALGAVKFDLKRKVYARFQRRFIWREPDGGEQVEHDAVRGALDLLASLHSAPAGWLRNLGLAA